MATAVSALLTIKEVCALLGGINPSTLYRGITAGRYPAPIHIGPNTSRWLRDEVNAKLAQLKAARAAA
jgi:predicted DNA-binding transcriptional regulator AlpA